MRKLQDEYTYNPRTTSAASPIILDQHMVEIAPGCFITLVDYSKHLKKLFNDPKTSVYAFTHNSPPRVVYSITVNNRIGDCLSIIEDPRLSGVGQFSSTNYRINIKEEDIGFLNCLFNNISRPEVQELGIQLFDFPSVNVVSKVQVNLQNLYAALTRVNVFNNSHETVTRFFTQELIKMNKHGWTDEEIEQLAKNLDRALYGKPPLSPLIKSLICGVIGALVGAAIGITVGAMATAWSGSFGALPGAIIGAAKGFSLGSMIGLGAGAVSGGALWGIYGFLGAKQARAEFDKRKQQVNGELGGDVSTALDEIFPTPQRK